MSEPKTKLVLRHVMLAEFPKLAVVRVTLAGFGEDVAWFFEEKTAKEYIDLVNKKQKETNEKS